MTSQADFLQLAPYTDEQVHNVLQVLLKAQPLLKMIQDAMPEWSPEVLAALCADIHSVAGFQERIMLPAVQFLERTTTDGITFSGLDALPTDRKYLFVSNHRDICLDPTFLSRVLIMQRDESTQMAIGDNLIMADWLTHLFKLNKTVIVQRNLPPRALLEASRKLSAYIHHVVMTGVDSFWIAQGEGRSKDGNDFTQSGLLKMITLAGGKQWEDALERLNPIPLSISYEWDPCDVAKARELMIREETGTYEKADGEDLQSILDGLTGGKGRVHLHFSEGLAAQWPQICSGKTRGDRLTLLVEAMDRAILTGYQCWPANYVAADLLEQNERFAGHYSAEDRAIFEERLAQRLDVYERAEAIKPYVLRMYANPVFNKLRYGSGDTP